MRTWLAILAAGTALVLSACSASQTLEQLPENLGGLPADAPSAPKKTYQYPAVHDMPPPRASKPLSDSELLKLENDLKAARAKQEKAATDIQSAPVNPPASAGNAAKP